MPGVTAVVQARMGSTRLPGKVLRRLGSRTVLAHVIERLRAARSLDAIVVATTGAPADDEIAREAERLGARVTRGSEEDVLARYLQALDEHGGDVGVRVTSDCPLLDPAVVDAAVKVFRDATPPLDYLSNTVERTYPRGYDVEVFLTAALQRAAEAATEIPDREHVTRYLYTHPGSFRLGVLQRPDPDHTAFWRVTLDTQEDWEVLEALVGAFDEAPGPNLAAVEGFLRAHPEVRAMNARVAQKAV